MTVSKWSVSGLCVTARPETLEAVRAVLNSQPGVEVHAAAPESCRLVVTQEYATITEHQDGLRAIQALPGVLSADLVIHLGDVDSSLRRHITGVAK